MPGLLSGFIGAIAAFTASRDNYPGDTLYKFYPSRTPLVNSTEYFQYNLNSTGSAFIEGGDGRTAGNNKIVDFYAKLSKFFYRSSNFISISWFGFNYRYCYCWWLGNRADT